jgi:hypothetical protein
MLWTTNRARLRYLMKVVPLESSYGMTLQDVALKSAGRNGKLTRAQKPRDSRQLPAAKGGRAGRAQQIGRGGAVAGRAHLHMACRLGQDRKRKCGEGSPRRAEASTEATAGVETASAARGTSGTPILVLSCELARPDTKYQTENANPVCLRVGV